MHVRFSRATRSSALPAFVVIAPQYGLANVAQSADKADILIGIPQSAPDDNVKSKRWRYGLASALGHKQILKWPFRCPLYPNSRRRETRSNVRFVLMANGIEKRGHTTHAQAGIRLGANYKYCSIGSSPTVT
jgi:hypothetical protein